MALEKHWDEVFSSSNDDVLGWFEKDFSQTLKFLEKIENIEKKEVFISGVGTSKIADELAKKAKKSILNDISKEALDRIRNRIDNTNIEYFQYDISKAFIKKCDIWLDRAVLHFLIEEEDINQYFENLKKSLSKDGYVLFAQFHKGTATTCASLSLHQYSLEEFSSRLGNGFSLVCSELYLYETPSKQNREYIYALFKRNS